MTVTARTPCHRPTRHRSRLARLAYVATIALVSSLACWTAVLPAPIALAQQDETSRRFQGASPATKKRGSGVSYTGQESVEADVSTHSIAVTSGFSGTKIVIFGAVNRSHQAASGPNVYDVIVVVEGKSERLVARKKSRVLGLWINMGALLFDRAPSYYTMASTRPIRDIADDEILAQIGVGFDHLDMEVALTALERNSPQEIAAYRDAVIRLKRNAKLYQEQDTGVRFIGSSLFRSSFDLPANVPVGPLKARIYLFREGNLIAQYTSDVDLRREGLQRLLFDLAFNQPFLYGLMAVIFAVIAGLSASAMFGRKQH